MSSSIRFVSRFFVGSLVAVAAIASVLPAAASPVTIPNAGFELRGTFDPTFPDGGWKYIQWGKEYWRAWQRTDNGGPVGIWNPGVEGTTYPGFGGNAPEGTYALWNYSRYSDGANNDGVNYFEAAAQLLTTNFDLYTAYTLTVQVGNGWADSWQGYALQLAVGGTNVSGATYAGSVTGGTVIAQDAGSLTVPVNGFGIRSRASETFCEIVPNRTNYKLYCR